MILNDTIDSLLVDVSVLTGFSEIRESWWTVDWFLNQGPKLEKHVLSSVENHGLLDLDQFPVQLRRLARGSLVDPLKMRYLRQLLLFCYKAEIEYTDTQSLSAFAQFEQTNLEVGQFGASLSKQSPRLLALVRSLCQSVLFKGRWEDICPFHGPGAVTTSKERWTRVYETIEAVYPFSEYFSTQDVESWCPVDAAEWDRAAHIDLIQAKLIAVPKDSRGPRLICVHPAEAVWIQQGLRCELERVIALPRRYDTWPRGHIRFKDQKPNGLIALLSSNSGHYATLDLKEASDRISDTLVQVLFGPYYKWFGCCRAQTYVVGDGKEPRQLHCYAPMGNATTFPVQSLVFWAICVASLIDRKKFPSNQTFVFGDDLLVPAVCAESVIDALHSFGLVVNQNKSFWRGTFRESCGVDAYQGKDVTPIRWKMRLVPNTLSDLQSLSDLAMRLRMAGYETAATTAYRHLRGVLYDMGWRLFLTNNPDHGSIAEYVNAGSYVWQQWSDYGWTRKGAPMKWSTNLHRYYSEVIVLEDRDADKAPGRGRIHVLESLCSIERTRRSHVPDRLAPRRVRLKRGWTEVR